MNRRLAGILLLTLVTASTVSAQDDGSIIKTHHVAGPVYMLEGQGGNIGISAGEDGVLMIDDQFERLAADIQQAIDDLESGSLRFVLNTHFHGDHTGGNSVFGQVAPIIAHDNVRERLVKGKDLGNEEVRRGLPVVTFADSVSLHFNGEEIGVVHYPTGHTDGDSIIYFRGSNVVHMGDHFFNGRFPFIDLAGGGDVEQYIENVRSVLEDLPGDVKIIPGHGPLATKADLQTFVDGVADTAEIIRERIDDGQSLDAIVEEGLPEKYAEWGEGFVSTSRWIGIVHNSLTR